MSGKHEALTKVIYSQIAFQGGSDEHFESVRGGMYDDAAQAVVEFLTSDEAVERAAEAAIEVKLPGFVGMSWDEIETLRKDARIQIRAAILAAVGGSDVE